jgi:tetratricopeptide (TPR) repeat protein
MKTYDKAIQCYTRAIQIEPVHSKSYYNLGVLYHQEGNYEKAIELYTRAKQIDPGDPRIAHDIDLAKQRLETDSTVEKRQSTIESVAPTVR